MSPEATGWLPDEIRQAELQRLGAIVGMLQFRIAPAQSDHALNVTGNDGFRPVVRFR
ncbi:MAG TPA: hypothetical protein VMC81_03965 [Rhodocyclaceae bacterium]|nr:hypothetical protein [Rhodocyclaceae bacterium]